MAGMMTENDWQAWRQEARQQTENLNQAPFVLDPSKLTPDQGVNKQVVFGMPGGGDIASMKDTISAAFEQYFGRPASEEDLSHWINAARQQTLAPQSVTELIAAAAKDPRNAGVLGSAGYGLGQGAGGAGLNFSAGMMGNALSGGMAFR